MYSLEFQSKSAHYSGYGSQLKEISFHPSNEQLSVLLLMLTTFPKIFDRELLKFFRQLPSLKREWIEGERWNNHGTIACYLMF